MSGAGGGFGNFGNPGGAAPGGAGFKQEQPFKQEKSQEAARVKTESDNRLNSSSRLVPLSISFGPFFFLAEFLADID